MSKQNGQFTAQPASAVIRRPVWLDEVEHKLGRPIRVLNLGNIANNGFQNTKVMRRAGLEADCVAYSYYHVMGTAEWEDADYRGSIGDSFYPDWWRVRLINYKRPKWFIQGPRSLCQSYIRAKYDLNPEIDEDLLWKKFSYETQLYNYKNSALSRLPKSPFKWPSWLLRLLHFQVYRLAVLFSDWRLLREKLIMPLEVIWSVVKLITGIVSFPFLLVGIGVSKLLDPFAALFSRLSKRQRLLLRETRRGRRRWYFRRYMLWLRPFLVKTVGMGASVFRWVTGKRFGLVFGDDLANKVTRILGVRPAAGRSGESMDDISRAAQSRRERRAMRRSQVREEGRFSPEQPEDVIAETRMEKDLKEDLQTESRDDILKEKFYQAYLHFLDLAYPSNPWIRQHYHHYSDIPPDDLRDDIFLARALSKSWEDIFDYYDIVLAYSTDGILPMVTSDRPFFTYEHGTLRSIPFEPTPRGRLCATSYRTCNQLMLTNLDTINNPPKLGMRPEQVIYLPHAIDDRKLLSFQEKHADLGPKNHKHPLILCPARQDWGDDDPSLMKGNDKLFRALKIIWDEGYRPRVYLFDWGRHVEKSKALIKELGIEPLITWVKPMKKAELWKFYLKSHVVVDQFSIPAFGGVTFEALTFSRRVITSIDEVQCKTFFGTLPPILNAREDEEIANALRIVLNDPEDLAGQGDACGEWAKIYHSSQRIFDLQLQAFEPVLKQIASDQARDDV